MQFITYRRVSTKKQGDSGLGLDAQDRDLRLFMDNYAPDNSDVVGSYTDVLSGSRNDRPELSKALDECRATGATLLVSKLDRLSRKVSFIASLMDDPKLSMKVASMPHADKFQLHIYAALAEQEREFISRRTKAALQEAKARGVKLGGVRPGFGERIAELQKQADSFASKVYPTISALRDNGATLQGIADELNRLAISTQRGGKWYPGTVRNALNRVESTA